MKPEQFRPHTIYRCRKTQSPDLVTCADRADLERLTLFSAPIPVLPSRFWITLLYDDGRQASARSSCQKPSTLRFENDLPVVRCRLYFHRC